MQALIFYLLLPILMALSILPFSVLYVLSDMLVFPLFFYVIKYRRKVVKSNLRNSFPNKAEAELAFLEKQCYHYFADLVVEVLKSFTISKKALLRRFHFVNGQVFDPYFEAGKSVIVTMGHVGNYELGAKILPEKVKHQVVVPYKKLSNPYFEKLFRASRSRFGAIMFPTFDTYKLLENDFGGPILLGLANDQSAPPQKAFWTRFLNQDTSFFVGTEKIAKLYNFPVFFAHISVPKRGYYRVEFECITHQPAATEEGEIMNHHARLLEKDILEAPWLWMWTHKRWKHKMPSGAQYGFQYDK
jgi:Kdo2-lipid IVA lauroyltransferase/acyltransferase